MKIKILQEYTSPRFGVLVAVYHEAGASVKCKHFVTRPTKKQIRRFRNKFVKFVAKIH